MRRQVAKRMDIPEAVLEPFNEKLKEMMDGFVQQRTSGTEQVEIEPQREIHPATITATAVEQEQKIVVQVIATDQGGEVSTNFKFRMNLGTVFDKMMKAWCGANGSDAVFKHLSRTLTPEDTPRSCGWSLVD